MSVRGSVVIGIALAIAGCRSASDAAPQQGSAAPKPAPKPTAPSTDLVKLAATTTAKGAVWRIGEPRLQVSARDLGDLAIRDVAKLAFATDRDAVMIWELATGKVTHRLAADPNGRAVDERIELDVSPDGMSIAMGYYKKLAVRRAPFDTAAFTIEHAAPFQFSVDGKFLAVDRKLIPAIVDVAQGKVAATAPISDKTRMLAMTVTPDGKTVTFVSENQVARWERATNQVAVLHKPNGRLKAARLAPRGSIAVVSDGKSLVRVELATGNASTLAPIATAFFALSPTGARLAVIDQRFVRVLDTGSAKELWSAKLTGVAARINYSDDENVFGYLEDNQLRIVDVGKGPRSYPAPSRFGGWLAEGVAAIQRPAGLAKLTVPTGVVEVIDASALASVAPLRPAAAPAWATWIGGAELAAEPSARHGVLPASRSDSECNAKLRVWTAKGGVKTLSMKPTGTQLRHEDPCWQIDGGWVAGISTKLAVIFDPRTGKSIASIDVGQSPLPKRTDLAHELYAAALSPKGTHVAIVWRRADVWGSGKEPDPADPREDVLHRESTVECEKDAVGDCKLEYFVDVWSLEGKPQRISRVRFDAAEPTTRTWPISKVATGAIAFTHDGRRLMFGFDDGDILIRNTDGSGAAPIERLHHAPITRIAISPNDGWVLSEDSAGEQRLWQLR